MNQLEAGRKEVDLPSSPITPVAHTSANLRSGVLSWEELSDTELKTLCLVDPVTGLRSMVMKVDRKMMRGYTGELARRATERMAQHLPSSVEVIVEIMEDRSGSVTASERLRAVNMLQDRVLGKTADKIELTASIKPYEDIASKILVDDAEDDIG